MKVLRAHDVLPQAESTRLLSINDVALWLDVSKGWVYDHVTRQEPRIPCIRFGELTRFRREDIEEFFGVTNSTTAMADGAGIDGPISLAMKTGPRPTGCSTRPQRKTGANSTFDKMDSILNPL